MGSNDHILWSSILIQILIDEIPVYADEIPVYLREDRPAASFIFGKQNKTHRTTQKISWSKNPCQNKSNFNKCSVSKRNFLSNTFKINRFYSFVFIFYVIYIWTICGFWTLILGNSIKLVGLLKKYHCFFSQKIRLPFQILLKIPQ